MVTVTATARVDVNTVDKMKADVKKAVDAAEKRRSAKHLSPFSSHPTWEKMLENHRKTIGKP